MPLVLEPVGALAVGLVKPSGSLAAAPVLNKLLADELAVDVENIESIVCVTTFCAARTAVCAVCNGVTGSAVETGETG